jgi:hypothetical protein
MVIINLVCVGMVQVEVYRMHKKTKELQEQTRRMRAKNNAGIGPYGYTVKFENDGIIYDATVSGTYEATKKFIAAMDSSKDFTRVEG